MSRIFEKYPGNGMVPLSVFSFSEFPRLKCLIMVISINGKPTETSASNLAELASELSLPQAGVAIALNAKMVQRANWENTPLVEEAEIIIIKAACGG